MGKSPLCKCSLWPREGGIRSNFFIIIPFLKTGAQYIIEISSSPHNIHFDIVVGDLSDLPSKIHFLKQVHGATAVMAPFSAGAEGDAMITDVPGVVCAVKTADCLPILVSNQSGTEVAAIHAGWKGLVSGVIEATFAKMKSPGNECLAWIGPAICQAHFEVGPEVREVFVSKNKAWDIAFHPGALQKFQGNLPLIAEMILKDLGVVVHQSGLCTYEDRSFPSYRRDNGTLMRMVSLCYIIKR